MTGTGFLYIYNGSFNRIHIYGNVFVRTPDFTQGTGTGVIGSTGSGSAVINGFNFHNNTIINMEDGTIFGFNGTQNNFTSYNNMYYRIVGIPNSPPGTHDYSFFSAPGGTFNEANAQNAGFTDPFVDRLGGDFDLAMATDAGKTLAAPYDEDMYGNKRGADGVWDRGAIEYSTTNIERRTLNAERRIPSHPTLINDGRIYNIIGGQIVPDQAEKTGIYFLIPDEGSIKKITVIGR
jgi:hypothetical protein